MNKSEQNVFCESEGMIAWEKKRRDGRKPRRKRKGKVEVKKEKERIKQKKINKRQ